MKSFDAVKVSKKDGDIHVSVDVTMEDGEESGLYILTFSLVEEEGFPLRLAIFATVNLEEMAELERRVLQERSEDAIAEYGEAAERYTNEIYQMFITDDRKFTQARILLATIVQQQKFVNHTNFKWPDGTSKTIDQEIPMNDVIPQLNDLLKELRARQGR